MINNHKARKYIEGGNQVSPKSLQSLFVGEVKNASYQPCSYALNSGQIFDILHEVWRTSWHTIFEVWAHLGPV